MLEGLVCKLPARPEGNACQRLIFKMLEGLVGKILASAELNAGQRHIFKMFEGLVGKIPAPAEVNACQRLIFKNVRGPCRGQFQYPLKSTLVSGLSLTCSRALSVSL